MKKFLDKIRELPIAQNALNISKETTYNDIQAF